MEFTAWFIGLDKMVPTEDIRKKWTQQPLLYEVLVLNSTVGTIFSRQGWHWLV